MSRFPGKTDHPLPSVPRRVFLQQAGVIIGSALCSLSLPSLSHAAIGLLRKPIRIGLIADLHHDVMHDAPARLDAFLDAMKPTPPDAIVQLGDFAQAKAGNRSLVKKFNEAHPVSLHVIGNHDTDGGLSSEQVVKEWGMKGRYYTHDVEGLRLLVLDGNDKPAGHSGGYPSHIGETQTKWLKEQLSSHEGPFLVLCHQPLAGPWAIDNAEEIQGILAEAASRIIIVINGHTHIDEVVRAGDIAHLHLNSASYQWVGGNYEHSSYPEKIHAEHPWISHTCPYEESLYTTLTLDPETLQLGLEGKHTRWVGKSPAQLGIDVHPDLIDGEQIVPAIRQRTIRRQKSP